jgi:predicted amidohydrolase
MKIALVQLDIEWESKKTNYRLAGEFTKRASQEGCDLIVFPEMFNTGFSMNVSAIAENKGGETASVLSEIAGRNGINLIAGYAAKSSEGGKGQNIAAVYNRKGECVARFAKLHPFSFAKEDQYYDAGNNTVVFNIDGMKAGIFICYDLRFPEVFRSIAHEVQAIFVIANWPSSRRDHWVTLLKARSIENQCFIIGVNRTGKDGNGIEYPGASHIFGPSGNEICFGDDKEIFITAEINPHDVHETRDKFPFLKDMRPLKLNFR